MKIKICGLKYFSNITALAQLNIDMMGFIFYTKSPRFVENSFHKNQIQFIPASVCKVGVFVNEKLESVITKIEEYSLNAVQLHGQESASYCELLMSRGVLVIKAFHVDTHFDFTQLKSYVGVCNYFLFDTKGDELGGNGIAFDWSTLTNYKYETPFFLSGGIGLSNINDALNVNHEQLIGIDVNSKIEIEPGLKSVELAQLITNKIRNYDTHKTG